MSSSAQIKSKILRRERLPGEYDVYRAALEWDLTDPIVIENRNHLKSEFRWKDRVEPYHHQVTNLMTFCRRLPVTLLADDVGLGKTISAGLVISELAARARLSRVLIVAPKLLGAQWKEELETKFNVPTDVVVGRDLVTAHPRDFGAVITTYNSARLYLDEVPLDRYEMLILDEAHKLRNLFGVPKPPQVAVLFKKALLERRFRYVLMLTATPIQNRLWDLYSLVDLLSSARGHENPFGSEGMFYRRFVADERDKARKLKPEAKEEFRSIIYGYMSRVRRGDAKLHFPDRRVQLHRVLPSADELRLIETIAKPIQQLNRLVQISILQALTSSPEALSSQLQNMARKRSVPPELAANVKSIVDHMDRPAKLRGLAILISQLRAENPDKWRLVIFTTRRETQTSIDIFLSGLGLKVGLINGDTSGRNRETLAAFWAKPPKLNVIVSTEAGSEGVNLQVANVLVNYDLPWNPMVVEQRIGRIQRLGTEHASVGIFNIVLQGTFEEFIVGRLMEKLQLATSAIGDIESLLEASGIGDEDDSGIDERIRQLVVAALAGKDVKAAVRMAGESIDNAKIELERERANIDTMLGGMQGSEHVGPRVPKLPEAAHSMDSRRFVAAAYRSLGGQVEEDEKNGLIVKHDGARERIFFGADPRPEMPGTNYQPGTSAFSRLVTRMASTGIHKVVDECLDADEHVNAVAREWVAGFKGEFRRVSVTEASRGFAGDVLLRARAVVQHDSYERLISVACRPEKHVRVGDASMLLPLPAPLQEATAIGLNIEAIEAAVRNDDGISEFCRFYFERREIELQAAGSDERKRHKLREDFTPRVEMTVVGLTGKVRRSASVRVDYQIDGEGLYTSRLSFDPWGEAISSAPEMGNCFASGKTVPMDCLGRCEISGTNTLQHLLVKSEMSGRSAKLEYTLRCAVSGKTILRDEAQKSDLTGALVSRDLLKKSALSGKVGEAVSFGRCDFTDVWALRDELGISELSRRSFRLDQAEISSVSGKRGHKSEFIACYETRLTIASIESEKCEVTGKLVRSAILQECMMTRKRVLPQELAVCSASGRRVLRSLLVTSSLSDLQVLPSEAVKSTSGLYCLPSEVAACLWSDEKVHPDDLLTCRLSGLRIDRKYLTDSILAPLKELLDGVRHTTDSTDQWDHISTRLSPVVGGRKYRILAACLSPNGRVLAARAESKILFGLKRTQIGFLYSFLEGAVVGRVALGKSTVHGWIEQAP